MNQILAGKQNSDNLWKSWSLCWMFIDLFWKSMCVSDKLERLNTKRSLGVDDLEEAVALYTNIQAAFSLLGIHI